MDNISIIRIGQLHPKVVPAALAAYKEVCEALTGKALCRVQEGMRDFATQAGYYALGRTKVNPDGKSLKKPYGNIITNAKAGTSYHQYGLAIDIVLMVDTDGNGSYETAKWDTTHDFDGDGKSDWIEAINIFKNHGFTWGGDWQSFKDLPHVEMRFGYTTSQLLAKYNAKDFILGTKYVKL